MRLHDPVKGTTTVLAELRGPGAAARRCASTPTPRTASTARRVDNNFATNKWVYLYYSPQTVTNVKLSDGAIVTQTTPNTTVPNSAASQTAWDPYVGYFQLSRFKFVDDAPGVRRTWTSSSEQQILRVTNNRQECCHVAGDIDFDKDNNLWMVTGDDTPAGGINANGYGPFEDQLTRRAADRPHHQRDRRHVHADLQRPDDGAARRTTRPRAQIDTALEALSNIGANNIQTSGGPANTANVNVFFRRALQQTNQNQITANGAGPDGHRRRRVDRRRRRRRAAGTSARPATTVARR